MEFHNDNSADASRVLPILGRVGADGRIVPRAPARPVADHQDGSPNDPREA